MKKCPHFLRHRVGLSSLADAAARLAGLIKKMETQKPRHLLTSLNYYVSKQTCFWPCVLEYYSATSNNMKLVH